MNYFDHFTAARKIFLDHYDKCAERNGCYDHHERQWADESFQNCEQIKMLDNGDVKIKWEHRCWWADCTHTDYYCILSPVEKTIWVEPYDLAKERRLN